MKSDKLMIVALVMMAVGIMLSCFTLWYTYSNRESLSTSIERNIREEIEKYNVKPPDDLTVDESRIFLAVVKYCATNNCTGKNGKDGQSIIGAQGIQGLPGVPGESIIGASGRDGYTPIKGVDYFDGEAGATGAQGEQGAPGKYLEEQCTVRGERRYIEQKYSDSDSWNLKYYLSVGQLCPQEVPE